MSRRPPKYDRSLPHHQFIDEVRAERLAIEADQRAGIASLNQWWSGQDSAMTQAHRHVYEHWVALGLWKDSWPPTREPPPGERWRHESPLSLLDSLPKRPSSGSGGSGGGGDDDDPDSEFKGYGSHWHSAMASSRPGGGGILGGDGGRGGGLTRINGLRTLIHNASRPLMRFLVECEAVEVQMTGYASGTELGFGMLAYETVRDDWTRRGIWDPKWEPLPMYRWLHERRNGPFEPNPAAFREFARSRADAFYDVFHQMPTGRSPHDAAARMAAAAPAAPAATVHPTKTPYRHHFRAGIVKPELAPSAEWKLIQVVLIFWLLGMIITMLLDLWFFLPIAILSAPFMFLLWVIWYAVALVVRTITRPLRSAPVRRTEGDFGYVEVNF